MNQTATSNTKFLASCPAFRLAVMPAILHVRRETYKLNDDLDKFYAYFKLTIDDFVTRDAIAVSRHTLTYERKDDGQRVTKILWVSNDLRWTGYMGKLGELLKRMRPAIAPKRATADKRYSTGIL